LFSLDPLRICFEEMSQCTFRRMQAQGYFASRNGIVARHRL
jgi:hypothetical protein